MKKIKRLFICLFLLNLCGCSTADTVDVKKSIAEAINRAKNAELVEASENNCVKEYYTYNASMNIGRLESDEISNQFIIEGNHSALSLDVSSIIQDQMEENEDTYNLRDAGTLDDLIYSVTSTYVNSSGEMIPFAVYISKTSEGGYFAFVQSTQFIFISSIDNGTVENTVYDMLVLLRSCTVNEELIRANYAGASAITYPLQDYSLFGKSDEVKIWTDEEITELIHANDPDEDEQ